MIPVPHSIDQPGLWMPFSLCLLVFLQPFSQCCSVLSGNQPAPDMAAMLHKSESINNISGTVDPKRKSTVFMIFERFNNIMENTFSSFWIHFKQLISIHSKVSFNSLH